MSIASEQQFHFRDGTNVADLEGLKEKLESVGYDEFYGHVNEDKNDFANWVEEILEQPKLATKLRAVSSIVETVELLNEALYPEEAEKAEARLKAAGAVDFQERIEEQLFVGTEDEVPPIPEEHPDEPGEEVSLPPLEEAEQVPREPVTTADPAHVPVTERVDRPVSKEEHMRFVVKQFIYGFLLGIIIGFLLANVLNKFVVL